MERVLLVIAVEQESQTLINKLKLKQDKKNQELYFGIYKNQSIFVLKSGIGKASMAMNLSKTISTNSFDYIINIGAAGATSKYNQGDKIIVSSAKYHDVDLTTFGYKYGQVPGFPEYFVTPQKTIDKFISKIENLIQSVIFTGDHFVESMEIPGDFLVDMEAASFFQTLYNANLKGFSFKVVSDIINGNNSDTYSVFEEKKIGIHIYDFFLQILEALKCKD